MLCLQISSPKSGINWQIAKTVSQGELVASGSWASAEVGVVVPKDASVYQDSEELRGTWGEEMVLGLMVGSFNFRRRPLKADRRRM